MKKILVPTDFSEEARNAYEVAVQIARRTGGSIKLLNVITLPHTANFSAMGSTVPSDSTEQLYVIKLLESTKKQMHKMIDSVKHDGVQVTHEVDVNTITDKIDSLSTEEGVDLIVMGSKGASGIQEMFIGSNTEKVVRLSKVPVLVVKERNTEFNVRSIVFPSNFDDESEARGLVEKVKQVQDLFQAQLHLLYVNTPGSFNATKSVQDKMHRFAERNGLQNYTVNVYNDSVEEDGIQHFANETNSDLIVMGTHGRTGLAHLFSGSITEDLVNHTIRPVLAYKIG